ncbi:patatin-like phospholipase [Pseudomassariella vexata]|uniref:Patatin-like phospholipase domain-containing protein n=1 Tax=Pseudomassariella vexata TaxID=1141098 RepID=A0A1Y2EET7_9PEZI|nr:patatin-like phospholipase [Pseudomassariella vexata]ORY69824.1 patatin-like phospholipase [Pseudomassariella vexata]
MAGESPKSRVSFLARKPHHNYGFPDDAFDHTQLPGVDEKFVPDEDIAAFVQALSAPEPFHSSTDDGSFLQSPALRSGSSINIPPPWQQGNASPARSSNGIPRHNSQASLLISAQNDWAPVNERVSKSGKRRRKRRSALGRSVDEAREGYLYALLRWPFLFFTMTWILWLGVAYLATRFYVWGYEYFVAWRGQRERLRRNMRATSSYRDWVNAAKDLDAFLGNQYWKEDNDYAYYDSKTVRRVWEQIRKHRQAAEAQEAKASAAPGYVNGDAPADAQAKRPIDDLKAMIEACVKSNFVGVENPRLYSETYYGTKNLIQNFVDEVEKGLRLLVRTEQIPLEEKQILFKHLHTNYGRTALCLSGGATFAYYHFGVVKALLEADQIPDVITGTSGGALVAALVATRTNEELKNLLVPALAHKITACSEPFTTWLPRWWKTGARFDSVDWARQCAWWAHGSMTFREAYERTGRILNVSCVPADPHSPTILCNYLTSPDCVIWSAVLASAAVPGILNPVVLMMKSKNGSLVPYSFGHKWKDGSLRTDIPIKALNLHFNVNFTIVSQVNPHISLFFFSSRGTVGSPVTHRKGRGWRGGYLGSALEQYIKLDLTKWLKVLRHLELLPRPLGQDWSQLWLQQFSGTVTIWPKSKPSDILRILADPDKDRLARMIHEGQQSAFPKLKFIANRLKVERMIEQGRKETRSARRGSLESIISEDDLQSLLLNQTSGTEDESTDDMDSEVIDDGNFEEAVGDIKEE